MLKISSTRVIFMEDHIPIRPDTSLLLGTQTSKCSLWNVVLHENNYLNEMESLDGVQDVSS